MIRLHLIRLLSFWLASSALMLQADPPQLEQKLLGEWRSGPCIGRLTLRADHTFEREAYSPGNNRLKGTWSLNWESLPPRLTLTCVESDAEDFVGRLQTPRVLTLTDDQLTLIYLSEQTAWPGGELDSSLGEAITRYRRVK